MSGRGNFDVWRPQHLPTGTDGHRRVAKASHRDGCNVAYMDGGSGWVQGEEMLPEMWDPR